VDVALGSLSTFFFLLLFYAENNPHIHHLVKVSIDAIEFLGDIATQSWGDFKMMSADRQIHTYPPKDTCAHESSRMPDQRQVTPLCAELA
jgi:hypothetical protein